MARVPVRRKSPGSRSLGTNTRLTTSLTNGNGFPTATPTETHSGHDLAKIFICYRREDSGPAAGRIYDRLEHHFDRGQVFMDVDVVPLGVDYRDYLDRQIGDCDLVLAVMGPKWLTARDGRRGRRLDAPGTLSAPRSRLRSNAASP